MSAGNAVPGRIVGKAHDHPVHQRLTRAQAALEAVSRLRALVDVGVAQIETQGAQAHIRLQPSSQQQGRVVSEMGKVDRPDIGHFLVVVRPLDSRGHRRSFQIRGGQIDAEAGEVHHGHGQGRQAGDQMVTDDEAVAPVTVAVAKQHHRVVDLFPLQTFTNVGLEYAAAVLLPRGAPLLPLVEIVARDEIVAHRTVIRALGIGERKGVVGVVAEILVGEVAVLWPIPAQRRPRAVELSAPGRAFLLLR